MTAISRWRSALTRVLVLVVVAAMVSTACTFSRADDEVAPNDGPPPTAASDGIEVPDTPAGEALAWLMAALGSRPDDETVEDRFTSDFLVAVPVTEVQDLIESLPTGPVLVGLRVDTEYQLLAEVDAGTDALLVEVVVLDDAPHRIDRAWFGPRDADDVGDDLDMPATPVGEALGWFFGALGTEPSDAELDEWVAPELLEQLPHDQLRSQLAGTLADPPPSIRSIHTDADTLLVARVRMAGRDHLLMLAVEDDPPHRIIELRAPAALPAPPMPGSVDDVEAIWTDLAPDASLLVAEIVNGQCRPLVEVYAAEPVPIASAFKLYVLAAVAEAIVDGELAWDQVVPIRDEVKSHPSGTFQELPDSTELTLEEHALAMIQASDNTATDHLIHLVGRESVEEVMAALGHGDPHLNQPLLTTREAFLLVMGGVSDDDLDAYVGGAEAERRALIDSWTDAELPPLSEYPLVATRTSQVGWFASPDDLCQVLVVLEELARWPGLEPLEEILAAPTALVEGPSGASAWYKGGNAPGVLNGTFLLRDDDSLVMVTGTLVHPQLIAVDEMAALRVLAEAGSLALGWSVRTTPASDEG